MSSTLQHLLEDVLDNLEDSGDLISTAEGRLDDQVRASVADHLRIALARIEEAMTRLTVGGEPEPSEGIGDAGPECMAERCIELAQGMFDSAGQPTASEGEIANRLQTIKHVIEQEPGGLRSLAGVA